MDPDPLSCILTLILSQATAAQPLITINQPTTASIIAAIVAIICLLISAFVSGSELAYFSLKATDYEKIKPSRRDTVKKLLDYPERLLATILISNNLVNVTIVILSSFVMSQVFEIESMALDFLIQTVILTFLILLFGEILPKLYSSNNNISFAAFVAPGLSVLAKLFDPLSRLMVKSTFIVNKMVTKRSDDISMDDLSQALELSDVKSEEEKDLLEGILTFGGKTVSEIMRPRIDVVDVDNKLNFEKVVEIAVKNGYSRMPVFENTPDNIKGILYAKDLLPYIGKTNPPDFDWTRLVRPAYFVPETRMIDDLLEDFRKKKIHMAIIVDEFGCTQGIATLEDVLEEIVGDIDDEYDTEEKSYTQLTDDTYIFDGKTLLNDFYKITGVEEEELEEVSEDAETIAGLLLNLKGDFPKEKERIEYGRFHFVVLNVIKHRIANVRIKILPLKNETKEEK